MNIDFFGIDKFYKKYSNDIISITARVYETGKFLAGPDIEKFEKNICKICNRKYAVAVANCTDAIYFALVAAGIKPGDEILTTSFSFIASVSPVVRIGAIPVFTDISDTDFMMEISDLGKKITPATKAILGVHLFGQMFPVKEMEEIAAKNNLILVEDAAQSFGSTCNNRPAGSAGLISCLSFDPTKIIGAFGSGGAILTDDKTIYETLVKLRYHGKSKTTGDYEIQGYNSRISTAQAALLNFQLQYLDEWVHRRNEIASIYTNELQANRDIILPSTNQNTKHIFHKFVIRANHRDRLRKYLAENGISTQVHYEKALFENTLFRDYRHFSSGIFITPLIKDTVLSLPIYPELTNREILYICKKINEFYHSV